MSLETSAALFTTSFVHGLSLSFVNFAIEFIEHKLRGSTWGKMVCQLVFLEG